MRRTEALRRMVRETRLSPEDFVYPLFVVPGSGVEKPIGSLPGQFNFSVDKAVEAAQKAADLGIPAVLLFGIPERKDAVGSEAWKDSGVVQKAIRAIKKARPGLTVMADACFCEYTDHGHCGVLHEGQLDNDASLENLARAVLSYAKAGVDIVAPSGMLDGFVGACRESLDEERFDQVGIMAYSAKYASAYYGPFREAVESAPQEGDRRGHQMDYGNVAEAVRECQMDAAEAVSDEINLPIAAYAVSGEYAMIEAAAQKGWIDKERIVLETLTGMRRAGADIIITYHAPYAAELLAKGRR
jgi:porphobilinogen synthase